nr:hypothetical protein L203_02111 [Cryptococcus depauperatus CBS 7841]
MPDSSFAAQSITQLIELGAAVLRVTYYKSSQGSPPEHPNCDKYSDIARGVNRLVAHYAALQIQPMMAAGEISPERIFVVLTSAAIDETLLEVALVKLGLASLLLSVNKKQAVSRNVYRFHSSMDWS